MACSRFAFPLLFWGARALFGFCENFSLKVFFLKCSVVNCLNL